VADADIVVLAASPRTNRRLLSQVHAARPGATLTDVGSVKRGICADGAASPAHAVRRRAPDGGARPRASRSKADLFHGRRWILTPDGHTAPASLRAVRALVRVVGARPVVMTPAEHDRAVAFLSHVRRSWPGPVRRGEADRVAAARLDVGGPAFRDMTRLARSPRAMWREILGENRREVNAALRALRVALRRRVCSSTA
jgi:prephenate dehydrogenase